MEGADGRHNPDDGSIYCYHATLPEEINRTHPWDDDRRFNRLLSAFHLTRDRHLEELWSELGRPKSCSRYFMDAEELAIIDPPRVRRWDSLALDAEVPSDVNEHSMEELRFGKCNNPREECFRWGVRGMDCIRCQSKCPPSNRRSFNSSQRGFSVPKPQKHWPEKTTQQKTAGF